MNPGVDAFMQMTPTRYRPGIGLRPGGEAPDLEPFVTRCYAALYESVACMSRLGLHVVVDANHHEAYSRPLGTLADAARRLQGLPALLVGVRCPLEVVMERRRTSHGGYVRGTPDEPFPAPVRRYQEEVHRPGIYDVELDTSVLSPEACSEAIRARLAEGPGEALERILALQAEASSR